MTAPSTLCRTQLVLAAIAALLGVSPIAGAQPVTAPGLDAHWSHNVSHARVLGQVDWTHHDHATVEDDVNWPAGSAPFYTDGPTDYFALRLRGRIEAPVGGITELAVSSDAGARLFIDDQLVINDDANHSFRTVVAVVNLAEGFHDIEIRYLERNYSHGLVLEWSGPAMPSLEPVPASAFSHEVGGDDDPVSTGGLRAYWAQGMQHATTLGEADWTIYDHTSAIPNLSWSIRSSAFYAGGPTDYFTLRAVGTIEIPESGSWTFNLGSDAGARLWIDGQLVVNDDANHSFRFQAGSITLSSGGHAFEVRYLERNYSQGLVVTWRGPSDAYESVIPPDVLTPATIVASGDTGPGLNAYWTSGTTHASLLGQVDWNNHTDQTIEHKPSWRISSSPMYPGGPTDYFALRLVGDIEIPSTGTWTFKVGSDAGAELIIDGQTVVLDDANHSFRFRSGTKALTAGPHDIEIRYLERNYSHGLVATWQGPGDAHEQVIPASAFTPDVPDPLAQGELRAYWSTAVSHATHLGEVDWATYDESGTVADISWEITSQPFYPGGPTDYFAARFVGHVDIPVTGAWTFGVGSDAGARLFIDGQLVVDDDANHSYRFTNGTITLTAGEHDFDLRYLERNYSHGLAATWKGPAHANQEIIPSHAFSLDPDEEPLDPGGGSLRAYWTLGTSHAQQLGEVDWTQYDHSTLVERVSWPISSSPFYVDGPTDYFAVKFVGTVEIPEAGAWTFKLGSDAGGRMWIDDDLVVDDDANHSFRFSSGTKTLTAGPHAIRIHYLERNYSHGVVATWQGPSNPYEEVIPSAALTPAALVSPGGAGGDGLHASWYPNQNGVSALDDVPWGSPGHTTFEDNISWRIGSSAWYPGGPTDYFGLRLTGNIEISEAGTWTFKLGSDAGARLTIAGQVVVDDGPNHSFRFQSGTIDLTPGRHPFEIKYLERNYSHGLVATWQGPSDAHESVIPSTAFPNVEALQVVQWREVAPDD